MDSFIRLPSKLSADILIDPYLMVMRYWFAAKIASMLPWVKPVADLIMRSTGPVAKKWEEGGEEVKRGSEGKKLEKKKV